MGKTLLLISSHSSDQVFAAELAIAAGLSLKHVKDPEEGAAIIAQETDPVVFVDATTEEHYQKFENAVQKTVGLFSDKVNANFIHFLSVDELGKVQFLAQSPLFGHFVQRSFANPKEAGQHYARFVKATLSERAFGLAPLLAPGTKIQVVKFASTSQKLNAVEAIKSYLLAAKFQSRMATVIANGVDEILMNAMFDAPVDDLGRQVHSSTPRSTILPLSEKSAVEMHVGFDGKYVGVTAIDLYGSLDKAKLLSHISKIYVKEEYKIRTSTAGAGIGLATVFRSGGSFFFVSEAQARTEVHVFFKKTDNFREFKDQFRFISTQFYF